MIATLARLALPAWVRATRPPRTAGAIAEAQRRTLRRLLRHLAPQAIGHQLGLEAVRSASDPVEAFRRLPISEYADYEALIARAATGERGVLFPAAALALAQTSGTTRSATSGERFIPQGARLLRHHRRAGAAALARALESGGAETLAGRLLMVGGSTALEHRHAVPMGDLSGIAAARLPRWISGRYEPGSEISAIASWEERLEALARRCAGRSITLAAGIPSWMLVVFERIARARGVARCDQAWPDLRLVIHGGHAIEPCIPALRAHLSDETWMMEVYPASEAFIAMGSRAWRLGDGEPPPLELLTDHGVYLEFAPGDAGAEGIVTADRLEQGGTYRVLVTTPGGLVRYQVGDLVRAEGPGQVRFSGRVSTRISVFGEHVEGFELTRALAAACQATGAEVAHYHVAPRLPSAQEPRGGHEWLVEFAGGPAGASAAAAGFAEAFTGAIDRYLIEHVLDYAAHRRGDGQLLPPCMTPVPTGAFAAALLRQGRCDAQRKVPQARPDRSFADSLTTVVAEMRS